MFKVVLAERFCTYSTCLSVHYNDNASVLVEIRQLGCWELLGILKRLLRILLFIRVDSCINHSHFVSAALLWPLWYSYFVTAA